MIVSSHTLLACRFEHRLAAAVFFGYRCCCKKVATAAHRSRAAIRGWCNLFMAFKSSKKHVVDGMKRCWLLVINLHSLTWRQLAVALSSALEAEPLQLLTR